MDITMDTLLSFLADYLWIIIGLLWIGYLLGVHFGVKEYRKKTKYSAEPVPKNGWRCPNCGEPHQYFEKVCSCGIKKEDIAIADNQVSDKALPRDDTIEEVKKLKELFDEGILTQEEFDAKKKQLLNL